MTECIERDAAIAYASLPKHLREYQTMNLDDAWEDGYDFAIRQIESIPAADVRPVVRGKWRKIGKNSCIFVCSACDKTFPYKTNFCPNCGADMRAEEGET